VITVHFVDRFARDKSIWEIETELHTAFTQLPGLERFSVYEYGATPLSSISAPIDVRIAGPDPKVLDDLAVQVEKRMWEVPCLNGISRSWDRSKEEVETTLDHRRMEAYGIMVSEISRILAAATQGIQASTLRVPGQNDIQVRVRLAADDSWSVQDLQDVTVMSALGPIPLREVADFEHVLTQDRFIRDDLQSVVNVYAYRDTMAISHLQAGVEKALAGMEVPPGYSISQEGEITYMNESFSRLGQAILISLVLLYLSLLWPAHRHHGGHSFGLYRGVLGYAPGQQALLHARVHGHDPALRDRGQQFHSAFGFHQPGPGTRDGPAGSHCPGHPDQNPAYCHDCF